MGSGKVVEHPRNCHVVWRMEGLSQY